MDYCLFRGSHFPQRVQEPPNKGPEPPKESPWALVGYLLTRTSAPCYNEEKKCSMGPQELAILPNIATVS